MKRLSNKTQVGKIKKTKNRGNFNSHKYSFLGILLVIFYLGGPAETSHLKIPPVDMLMFSITRLVGDDSELTDTPKIWYLLTGGVSKEYYDI